MNPEAKSEWVAGTRTGNDRADQRPPGDTLPIVVHPPNTQILIGLKVYLTGSFVTHGSNPNPPLL